MSTPSPADRRRSLRRLAATAACVGATAAGGCAAPMYAPPAGAPTARLEIVAQNFGVAGNSDYWLYDNPQCRAGSGAGRLAFMSQGVTSRSVELEAGRPAYVRTWVSEWQRDALWRTRYGCLSVVRLVPVAGRSYRISNAGITAARTCSVTVIDAATGRTPDEVQPLAPEPGCLPGETGG